MNSSIDRTKTHVLPQVLGVALLLFTGCEGEQKPLPPVQGPQMGAPMGLSSDMANEMNSPEMSTPFMFPGMVDPTFESADKTELADDAEVIGIVVGDVARAYHVTALSSPATHVVNDVLGGRPVTVTYCDRADCARVLTRDGQKKALGIGLGGWMRGKMSLQINGKLIPQDDLMVDYSDFPFERMTWKEWKAAHPTTVVFTNRPPSEDDEEPEETDTDDGGDAEAPAEADDPAEKSETTPE
jgi:Protein of unknown function (DUF3179)